MDVQPLDGIKRRFPIYSSWAVGKRILWVIFRFFTKVGIQRRLPFYNLTIDRFGVVSVLPAAGENEAAETDVGDARWLVESNSNFGLWSVNCIVYFLREADFLNKYPS